MGLVWKAGGHDMGDMVWCLGFFDPGRRWHGIPFLSCGARGLIASVIELKAVVHEV